MPGGILVATGAWAGSTMMLRIQHPPVHWAAELLGAPQHPAWAEAKALCRVIKLNQELGLIICGREVNYNTNALMHYCCGGVLCCLGLS